MLLVRLQVCVIVDEEGTEAAAVTAVVMMRATAVMAATPVIRWGDQLFSCLAVDCFFISATPVMRWNIISCHYHMLPAIASVKPSLPNITNRSGKRG
jgi:hypothetical protein